MFEKLMSSSVAMGFVVFGMAAGGYALEPSLIINDPPLNSGDTFGRNLMVTQTGNILTGSQLATVDGHANAGIAYLVDGTNGNTLFTIPNPEPETEARFGSFSWAGDTRMVISSFWKSDGTITKAGRAYVFDLATGDYTLTINNPDPAEDDQFGYGVGMLGDVAIISARGDDTAGDGTGTVYLFDSLTGSLLRTISCPNPTTQDNFGYSVAGIGTDKILVGAPNDDTGAADSGAAYLMNANTGATIFKITNPNPADAAAFGFQVRAFGEDLLIGSPGNKTAYLYDGTTGQMLHQFVSPNPQDTSVFGSCISSVGDNILVGDPYFASGSTPSTGAAFLFSGVTGSYLKTFFNPTPAAGERFGVSVGGINGKPVISADQATVNNIPLIGTVYVYDAVPAAAHDWTLYQ